MSFDHKYIRATVRALTLLRHLAHARETRALVRLAGSSSLSLAPAAWFSMAFLAAAIRVGTSNRAHRRVGRS